MNARLLLALAAVVAIITIIISVVAYRPYEVNPQRSDRPPALDRSASVQQPLPQRQPMNPNVPTAESTAPAQLARQSFDCSLSDFDASGQPFTSLQALNEFNRKVSSALAASQDPEHLLSAALFGQDGRFLISAMRDAVDLNPKDSRYRWHLLQACLSDHYQGDCDIEAIEAEAIRIGGGSAHIWTAIAAGHARNDETREATVALRNAIGAPEYRDYRVEDILMLERSLSAASELSYFDRMGHAFDAVDRVASIGSDLYETCQQRVQAPGELAAYCIQLAERIESSNTTVEDASFAIIIQKLAYEALGNIDKLAEVEARQQRLNQRIQEERENEGIVLRTNSHVFEGYVAAWSARGEIAAMNFLEQETERLLANADYDPCLLIPDRGVSATPDP